MLLAQQKHPVINDWFSGVTEILLNWNIDLGLDQIRNIKRKQVKAITKNKGTRSSFVLFITKKHIRKQRKQPKIWCSACNGRISLAQQLSLCGRSERNFPDPKSDKCSSC